jgi:lipopolysaccharide assembly protein A
MLQAHERPGRSRTEEKMQLVLIFGIAVAVVAVIFALQNNVPVTVSLIFWSFNGSLALVLLLAIGLGAIIAGLLSSPAVIGGRWAAARLRRQVAALEGEKADLAHRVGALEAELKRVAPSTGVMQEQSKPYVGLKTLLTSGGNQESDRKS